MLSKIIYIINNKFIIFKISFTYYKLMFNKNFILYILYCAPLVYTNLWKYILKLQKINNK